MFKKRILFITVNQKCFLHRIYKYVDLHLPSSVGSEEDCKPSLIFLLVSRARTRMRELKPQDVWIEGVSPRKRKNKTLHCLLTKIATPGTQVLEQYYWLVCKWWHFCFNKLSFVVSTRNLRSIGNNKGWQAAQSLPVWNNWKTFYICLIMSISHVKWRW